MKKIIKIWVSLSEKRGLSMSKETLLVEKETEQSYYCYSDLKFPDGHKPAGHRIWKFDLDNIENSFKRQFPVGYFQVYCLEENSDKFSKEILTEVEKFGIKMKTLSEQIESGLKKLKG